MAITHAKVSAKSDGGDSSLVLPSDWNAGHVGEHNAVTIGGDAEHSLATQVLSGVDASASQKGHASFSSKFTVASGAVDLAAGGHGAAEHADVSERLWTPARAGLPLDSGTASSRGSAPDSVATVLLTDAATQGFTAAVAIPSKAVAAQPLSLVILWFPAATDATPHTVRWSIDAFAIVSGGADVLTAGTTTAFTGISQAQTIGIPMAETTTQVLASVNANDVIRINIRRLGSDGADTYVGNVHVVGFWLVYTASGS